MISAAATSAAVYAVAEPEHAVVERFSRVKFQRLALGGTLVRRSDIFEISGNNFINNAANIIVWRNTDCHYTSEIYQGRESTFLTFQN